jgi:hypothetical protein
MRHVCLSRFAGGPLDIEINYRYNLSKQDLIFSLGFFLRSDALTPRICTSIRQEQPTEI